MSPENKTIITFPNHFPECGSCTIVRNRSAYVLTSYEPLANQKLVGIQDITFTCDIHETPVVMTGEMTMNVLLNPNRDSLDVPVEIPEKPVHCPHFASTHPLLRINPDIMEPLGM